MGFHATQWLYDNAPEIPRGASRYVGADRVRLILGVLAHYADDDTGETCPAQTTIAATMGPFVTRREISAALDVLVDLGLIVWVAAAVPRVRGTTYRLTLDAQLRGDSTGVPPRTPRLRGDSTGGPQGNAQLGGETGGTPPRDQLPHSLTTSNSPTHGVAREAKPDDEISERLDPDRVQAILETAGAPRRLTTRGRPPDPEPEPVAEVVPIERGEYEFAHLTPAKRRRRRA